MPPKPNRSRSAIRSPALQGPSSRYRAPNAMARPCSVACSRATCGPSLMKSRCPISLVSTFSDGAGTRSRCVCDAYPRSVSPCLLLPFLVPLDDMLIDGLKSGFTESADMVSDRASLASCESQSRLVYNHGRHWTACVLSCADLCCVRRFGLSYRTHCADVTIV